jgi:cytochrome c peroxidase
LKTQFYMVLGAAALLMLATSCKKTDTSAAGATVLVPFAAPATFGAPVYNFVQNPLTVQGIALGRALFYDGILSKDGNFSCAGCHQQSAAFGTFDHNLSHGINNSHTLRNAPPLQNLAWYRSFHADGGVAHLDVQPINPITSPVEMGESLDGVLQKLRTSGRYKTLFKAAFGSELINTQRLMFALSQFMLTMVSARSKYDLVKAGKATFNLPESLGYDIFQRKCASCHAEPLFTDQSFRNIGFSIDSSNTDVGRMLITRQRSDSLKFRVPSLRNVLLSFPYGHDGRVVDVFAMLDHYTKGVIQSPTLDPALLGGGMVLSNFEKGQLVAFLGTLTDTAFIKNKALAAP